MLLSPGWMVDGLAEDVRYYGRGIRDEAEKQIKDFEDQVERNKWVQ